jgi:hypothetical protein
MALHVQRSGPCPIADRRFDGDESRLGAEAGLQLAHAIVLRLEGDDARAKSQEHLRLGSVVGADVEAQVARADELRVELAIRLVGT